MEYSRWLLLMIFLTSCFLKTYARGGGRGGGGRSSGGGRGGGGGYGSSGGGYSGSSSHGSSGGGYSGSSSHGSSGSSYGGSSSSKSSGSSYGGSNSYGSDGGSYGSSGSSYGSSGSSYGSGGTSYGGSRSHGSSGSSYGGSGIYRSGGNSYGGYGSSGSSYGGVNSDRDSGSNIYGKGYPGNSGSSGQGLNPYGSIHTNYWNRRGSHSYGSQSYGGSFDEEKLFPTFKPIEIPDFRKSYEDRFKEESFEEKLLREMYSKIPDVKIGDRYVSAREFLGSPDLYEEWVYKEMYKDTVKRPPKSSTVGYTTTQSSSTSTLFLDEFLDKQKDTCLNGGNYTNSGECECPMNYRGEHCEHHISKCDIRQLAAGKKIRWVCTHTKNDTKCSISCKKNKVFKRPPADEYKCWPDGTWEPKRIPRCRRRPASKTDIVVEENECGENCTETSSTDESLSKSEHDGSDDILTSTPFMVSNDSIINDTQDVV